MPSFGATLLVLAAVSVGILLLYLFYGLLFRAFRRVGFTQGEAGLILLGSLFLGLVDVPLFVANGHRIGVNLGGAVVPLVVAFLVLRRTPSIVLEAIVGVTLVAFVSYFVSTATPEGIVSPFPLWLAPPLVAALLSLLSFWREETYAAPLAYVAGTLGAVVGGDLAHLPDFLAQPASEGLASIGGAQVFDMVFLTGILAVALDVLVFRERRRAGILDEEEGIVFRTTTPTEIIRDFDPSRRSRP